MPRGNEFEPENAAASADEDDVTLAAIDDGLRDARADRTVGLEEVREVLENRWNDLKSGRVAPLDGKEAVDRLRQKSDNRRRS